MSGSSGRVGVGSDIENFGRAEFLGSGSPPKYRYAITHGDGADLLNVNRRDGSEPPYSRRLTYFVGSGIAARSFLMETDGFLYEAPVTWYSASSQWNFSPGYAAYSYPFLTRAVAPGCLACHAGRLQPITGTQNGYRTPPFLENGVGCERCHGPGSIHARTARAADIVNPARLPAERRDSVCRQCHLSGEIRIDKPGANVSNFIAGENLADFTTAFVREASSPRMKVTSHVEKLAQSACLRSSGNRMWCGTCHDPHFVPAASEKVAWFRSKCLNCHTAAACKGPHAARAAQQDSCIECHMPRAPVGDAEHVVYTDHSIPRRPLLRDERPSADTPLIAFGGGNSTQRDLGLAYAIVAIREANGAYRERAFQLLNEAVKTHPDDPQTLSYLADLYKGRGSDEKAAVLYERLLRIDPAQSGAPAALGAYHLEQGHYEDAIRLWTQTLKISPSLVLVRLNLAVALMKTGRREEARAVLRKALEFNPAFNAARKLLSEIGN